MKIVLDASAVAKWFIVEEESAEMKTILSQIVSGRLEAHAPSILQVELANLLRYAKGLTHSEVKTAVQALAALGITFHDDYTLLPSAIETAFEKNLTVYDSLYVALAESLGATLITYDKEILGKYSKARKATSYLEKKKM